MITTGLVRSRPPSAPRLGRPVPSLLRRSISRRPWAIGTGAVVVSLIVAMAVSMAGFAGSYDAAKVADARYANGADLRITPGPNAGSRYGIEDAVLFDSDRVSDATPIIYGLSNVILRSDRTSDPANLAAVDPATYSRVAPVEVTTGIALDTLRQDPNAILLSREMAEFLKTGPGESLDVLLARATDQQVETTLRVAGLFDRLPGFPDGADAIMSVQRHGQLVPTKAPDFFLAATGSGSDLDVAVASLRGGELASQELAIDTRASTFDRDQSSLAALNLAGLVDLNSGFALAMAVVTIAMFVFGLLLQRRREYVTLRAQGMSTGEIRRLITVEAAIVVTGGLAGVLVGIAMGLYLVAVLRPLFVLTPTYTLPMAGVVTPLGLIVTATLVASVLGAHLVSRLEPTELLRDE